MYSMISINCKIKELKLNSTQVLPRNRVCWYCLYTCRPQLIDSRDTVFCYLFALAGIVPVQNYYVHGRGRIRPVVWLTYTHRVNLV